MFTRPLKRLAIKPIRNIFVSILFLYGCAATGEDASNANPTANANGMPEWMQNAMARELDTPFKPTSYSIKERGIELKLPGKFTSEVPTTAESTFFRFDIGTQEDMACEILYEPVDPAFAISFLANNTLNENEAKFGKVSGKQIYYTHSGTYENRPYHALEWIANMGEGEKKAIILIKYRVALIDQYSIACQHVEFGYRQTFENAFKFVVDNFQHKKTGAQPYFTEVVSMSIGDKVIGFLMETFTEDADGDTIISSISSMLIPITNESITTVDSSIESYSTPEGALINAFKASNVNGVLNYNLSLSFDAENRKWVVDGEFKGKSFNETLNHDDYIDTQLGQRLVVRDIARTDDANSGTVILWSPDLNPAEVITSTFNVTEKSDQQRKINFALGPIQVEGMVNENGAITQATYVTGPQVMSAERLWISSDL